MIICAVHWHLGRRFGNHHYLAAFAETVDVQEVPSSGEDQREQNFDTRVDDLSTEMSDLTWHLTDVSLEFLNGTLVYSLCGKLQGLTVCRKSFEIAEDLCWRPLHYSAALISSWSGRSIHLTALCTVQWTFCLRNNLQEIVFGVAKCLESFLVGILVEVKSSRQRSFSEVINHRTEWSENAFWREVFSVAHSVEEAGRTKNERGEKI